MTTNNDPKKFPLSAIQAIEQLQLSINQGGNHGVIKAQRALILENGPTLMDIVSRFFAESMSALPENIQAPVKQSIRDSRAEFWSGVSTYPFITNTQPLGYYIDKIKGKWNPREDTKIKDPGLVWSILSDDRFREMHYGDLSTGQQGAFRMAWDSYRRMTGKDPLFEDQ